MAKKKKKKKNEKKKSKKKELELKEGTPAHHFPSHFSQRRPMARERDADMGWVREIPFYSKGRLAYSWLASAHNQI